MLGKLVGAIAGERAAQHVTGINGPVGAALGAGAVSVVRRFGPLGFIALAVGGYAFKRYRDKQKQDNNRVGATAPAASPSTVSTEA